MVGYNAGTGIPLKTMAQTKKRPIQSYTHRGKKRANNPPVGLVTPENDPEVGKKKTYTYDPHLDPQLQWAGKTEHTSLDVDTVSLHVHERIEPRTIIEAVRKTNGNGNGSQVPLFEQPGENPPLREAIEFYRHRRNWSNRLIAGDSLLVMNSLLEKEGMAGKVQCVYMDPPYGIRYGSNFQPFINRRDVKDGKDEDLTTEPEMIKAFRDTWELGIHSYLTYMRDRLLLARELLTEGGSCFVQISDENVHLVRSLMDEVFGVENFVSLITFRKNTPLFAPKLLGNYCDYLLWFAKDKAKIKYHRVYKAKVLGKNSSFRHVVLENGEKRKMTKREQENPETIPPGSDPFVLQNLLSSGYTESCYYDFEFEGRIIKRGKYSWATTKTGMEKLISARRVWGSGIRPGYVQKLSDYPVSPIESLWSDMGPAHDQRYVVETSSKVIQRCILMTTDPGDLVFDPTCGSGTTAHVAEQWGRRWITCDTSRVAVTLARQRLMTANFDYYQLAYPKEGVGSGFKYKTVPHITLRSIANDEPPATETLYDQPLTDRKRARVTGPFTVEAVPAPMVKSIAEVTAEHERTSGETEPQETDASIARSGETLRQDDWRSELLKTGIRGKNGQHIAFSRVESLPCRYLSAEAETKPDTSGADRVEQTSATAYQPQRVVISFGPEHAPLEQRQVEHALEEAGKLRPKPKIIIFAAFQFDPEAAKDIDEVNWPGMTLLKVQMNADLQTEDLKKKRASNDSFWLIGQPDVELQQISKGDYTGKWLVEIHGFDYFNTKTGELESGSEKKIALWMLDTDYDGRSLYPRQVFFPIADDKEGWSRLARNLRAEIDEDLIEAYRGTVSLPFEVGAHKRIAVKIVDDRGIESLRILNM